MFLSSPMYYCTLSLTVCKCTPCQQSKPHQCNRFFFSRGHDPYTHACKARPPSTDGWTSLSVIVIVIVISFQRHQLFSSWSRVTEVRSLHDYHDFVVLCLLHCFHFSPLQCSHLGDNASTTRGVGYHVSPVVKTSVLSQAYLLKDFLVGGLLVRCWMGFE